MFEFAGGKATPFLILAILALLDGRKYGKRTSVICF